MKPLVPSEVPTGTEPSVIAASDSLQAPYVLSEYSLRTSSTSIGSRFGRPLG
jgi:hypothetical protein